MGEKQKGLNVTTSGKDLEISNGTIQVRLVALDGGYAQEYYAADTRGHFQLLLTSLSRNLILSSEHRECSSPMIAGHRPHLFGVSHDSLRMAYSKADIIYRDAGRVVARLTGSVQGHSLTCDIDIEAENKFVHITVTDELDRTVTIPVLEYLMSSYAFLPGGRMVDQPQGMDYIWAPNLRPSGDSVIGDNAFYSPAAIIQYGPSAAALIPDVEALGRNRVMPAVLDMDFINGLLFSPLLSYGFCGYEPAEDGRCSRHDITLSRRLSETRLTYAYYLGLDATCKRKSAHKEIARFFWLKHGDEKLKQIYPVSCSMQEISGQELTPDARAAYGLWVDGITRRDDNAAAQAQAIIDNILSSPQDDGLFPTLFNAGAWSGCKASPGSGYYSTIECSIQLYWLLKWHTEVASDPRIISYCRKYADFLIEAKLRNGAIPSWYTQDRIPLSILRSSAQTAASALFLAELAKATKLKMYLHAAESSAKYIFNEIAPGNFFGDLTCLNLSKEEPQAYTDPHSGVQPQSAYSMLWAAQMAFELHCLTSNPAYLRQGADILDKLCLFQSTCDRHWATEGTAFGLLKRGNLGPESDVELTAEFGRCAMQYGAAMGEQEYFERGAAALRAVMSAEYLSPDAQARIAGTLAAVRFEFGSAYVHVGRKWAAATLEHQLRRFDIQPGAISLELAGHTNGSKTNRIVFGGLRRTSYKTRINGNTLVYSRKELEAGIPIPPPILERSDIQDTHQIELFGQAQG